MEWLTCIAQDLKTKPYKQGHHETIALQILRLALVVKFEPARCKTIPSSTVFENGETVDVTRNHGVKEKISPANLGPQAGDGNAT